MKFPLLVLEQQLTHVVTKSCDTRSLKTPINQACSQDKSSRKWSKLNLDAGHTLGGSSDGLAYEWQAHKMLFTYKWSPKRGSGKRKKLRGMV
ncbi:hypothetical protein L1987_53626 [Smallanthus sonchifolius]|uniref:Uncharacterized protein n=1 Tax=Smallanthus sonchifolius TaxID=185202 RepID=A0ACB9EX23_9ASTR|nr:hypothetical protein L1987_53626 [Smallanthus sonchifolius]